MGGEKKRRGRRTYLSDFQRNVSGEYVYTGRVLEYISGAAAWKKQLGILWALTAAASACIISAGCVSNPGMKNCFYVIAPYVAALGFNLSCVWAMLRLSAEKGGKVREYVFDAAVKKLPARTLASAAFSGLDFAASLIFAALNGIGNTAAFLAFQLLTAFSAASSLILRGKIAEDSWK